MKDEKITDTKGLKKVRGRLDKILLGVVVGSAVGSILGITLAPKSGKETRSILKQKGKETWEKISNVIEERKGKERKKEKKNGFWHLMNRVLIKKKKKDE